MDKAYIDELKREYNSFIARIKKGERYLDKIEVPVDEREKWIPAFKYLIDNCNRLINTFEHYGVSMTDEEIREGFKMEVQNGTENK